LRKDRGYRTGLRKDRGYRTGLRKDRGYRTGLRGRTQSYRAITILLHFYCVLDDQLMVPVRIIL